MPILLLQCDVAQVPLKVIKFRMCDEIDSGKKLELKYFCENTRSNGTHLSLSRGINIKKFSKYAHARTFTITKT